MSNAYKCAGCGSEIEGEPVATVESFLDVDIDRAPVIVAPGFYVEEQAEADVCGGCIAEAAPDVNINITIE